MLLEIQSLQNSEKRLRDLKLLKAGLTGKGGLEFGRSKYVTQRRRPSAGEGNELHSVLLETGWGGQAGLARIS